MIWGDKDKLPEYQKQLNEVGEINLISNVTRDYTQRSWESIQFKLCELLAASLLLIVSLSGYGVMSYYEHRLTYGIYIQCGMRQGEILRLTALSSLLIFIPANAVGSLSAIAVLIKRRLDMDGIILSIILSAVFVLILYLLSTAITFIRIKNYNPKELLTESKW